MSNILRDAMNLDIYDMNVSWTSEKMGVVNQPDHFGKPRQGLLIRLASLFVRFLRSIPTIRFVWHSPLPQNHLLLFGPTKNNKDSLKPLAEYILNSSFIGTNKYDDICIPEFYAYFFSLPFIPLVIAKFIKAKGTHRKSFYFALDSLILTYGYYILCRILLRKLKPAAVVVSNDHTFRNRVIVKAAAEEGIITIFTQHASTVDNFPPLMYDYALLDGLDAVRKYDDSGESDTMVFMIGMSKFDYFFDELNSSKKVKHVGICVNVLEPCKAVEELCKVLKERFPDLRLSLRPHPKEKRIKEWADIASRYSMDYRDPSEEMAFEFLKRNDAIIACESGIHLEAALLNVYPIYYDFNDIAYDHYSFHKNGLLDKCIKNSKELILKMTALTEEKPDVRMRTKQFCGTVGTSYDGKSALIGSDILINILEGNPIDMNIWKPVDNLKNLKAFKLKEI